MKRRMKTNRALKKKSCAGLGLFCSAKGFRAMRGFMIWLLSVTAALAPAAAQAVSCEILKTVGLEGATINSAETVGPGAFIPPAADTIAPAAQRERAVQAFKELPTFCRVAVTFKPAPDSDIKVEVWMPASGWNGRFLGVGNGGWGGEINYNSLAGALRQGFATGSSDMGTGGFSAPNRSTWTVLESDDRLKDFGFRSTHLMTVAAKTLIQAFYEAPPKFSYWNGCSTGGKEGLEGAQLPVARACPFRKDKNRSPSWMRLPASSMLRRAATPFSRSMKMKRPAHMAQPKSGIRASCFLAMMRKLRGIARNTAQMSSVEAWLAINT